MVVEITNNPTLRDIQIKCNVAWVMMVAPVIALVVCNPYGTNLDTLKQFITVLDEYNKGWGKRRVSQGAYYFERLVLSKYLKNKDSINKSTCKRTPRRTPRLSGRSVRT